MWLQGQCNMVAYILWVVAWVFRMVDRALYGGFLVVQVKSAKFINNF